MWQYIYIYICVHYELAVSFHLLLSLSTERFDTKEDRARHNARKVCSYHGEFSVVDNYVAQLYDTE